MDWKDLPPLTALRAFAALAETGSFSAAGAALNVSHAAISQQVRGLEERLGTQLALREGRGISLTAEGTALARELEQAFAQMGEAVAALTGQDAARPLQVSVTPSFASNWMMPRLHRFRAAHPGIELMLNPSAQVVPLQPGGVDVAIRFGTGNWPGLEAEFLIPTRYVIAAHRDLVRGMSITSPNDLKALPWLQEYGTNEMTNWIERQGFEGLQSDSVTHLPGNMLVEAIKRGDAVGATVDIYLADEVEAGTVKILFAEERENSGYWQVTRPGVQRPPLRAFTKWLRAELSQG